MNVRLTLDAWALELAKVTARRATCLRRAVGCVLLDDRGHVLSTGYNGVAMGQPHCNEATYSIEYCGACGYEVPADLASNVCPHCGHLLRSPPPAARYPHACAGATSPSGTNLDCCQAIHAEQNALLQCRDVSSIWGCYVTVSPCLTCVKLLMNTGCRRIVFAERYAHDAEARRLWEAAPARRSWECR